MPNPNDRILKENFFVDFLPIIERILGLKHIKSTREVTDKLQHTLEREPDFVRIVETEDEQEYILHLEFQSTNDKEMLQRMAEYHALLLRRYNLPIQHHVLYFGNAKPNMPTRLSPDKVFEGFTLKNMKDLKASELLKANTPEEVILAILADFQGVPASQIVEKLLSRLKELIGGKGSFSKYTTQLTVLSGLRKLEKETKNQLKNMAIDLKDNLFYKEAMEKGLEKGLEKGIEQRNRELASQFLNSGEFTLQKIASLLDVPLVFVEMVAEEMKK